ncbi:MAG: hypothetical protein KKD44_08435 [Proteobacteria bacterium]|nr:hypothetical protein [Pseudomonadota bacterium]
MAKSKDLTLNTKETEPKEKKKGSRKKVLLLVLLLLVLVCGVVVVYILFFSKKPAVITTSHLPKEIIVFSFDELPGLYEKLLSLNEEIILTQKEIDRIETVATTYPDQRKIADTEKKSWTVNLAALNKCLTDFEKQMEMLYVSYQVNPETGKTLMDEKKDDLEKTVETVVNQSKTMTDKLRAIENAKSFIEKTKDKF